jgi:hypothetical protein
MYSVGVVMMQLTTGHTPQPRPMKRTGIIHTHMMCVHMAFRAFV